MTGDLPHEEIIRQVPLFAALGPAEAEELYAAAERIHASAGERIIEEGASGETLFIVLSGELEVTKRDGNRDVPLATRTSGDFIGEMSLLEQAPRTASVRAVRDSDLLSIGPAAFRRLLEANPTTATTILRTVPDACAARRRHWSIGKARGPRHPRGRPRP